MSQIFGQIYATAYDLLYKEKDYDGETTLLVQLFQKYAAQPVRSVLDLGCGTGNHALRLATQGYHVIGIDRSAEMLAIADRKAREQASSVRFNHADIRNADVGKSFDAALMMFAVLSYQTEDADVLAALRTARRHMDSSGLLIFDVWYGPAVLSQGTKQRVRTIDQAGTTLERTSSGTINTLQNVCHITFRLEQKNGQRADKTNESHTMRYFFQDDIDKFLKSADFRLLRLGAFPSFHQEPDDTTWNVMALAIAA
jgi:SAM-dependent methyltransferase